MFVRYQEICIKLHFEIKKQLKNEGYLVLLAQRKKQETDHTGTLAAQLDSSFLQTCQQSFQ